MSSSKSQKLQDYRVYDQIREQFQFHSNNNQERLNSESQLQFYNSSPLSDKTSISQIIKQDQGQNSKQKRKDGKSKCLSQNLYSNCQTKVSRILTSGLSDKRQRKRQAKQVKDRLNQFLKENKVKNNQLILLFISIFLRFQSAQAHHFEEIRKELKNYLEKRQKEAENESPLEEAKIKRKIAINRMVIDKYFAPQDIQIDRQWIREVCGELFTGRQKETINKPIMRLQILQAQLTQSITQQSLIQSYLA